MKNVNVNEKYSANNYMFVSETNPYIYFFVNFLVYNGNKRLYYFLNY